MTMIDHGKAVAIRTLLGCLSVAGRESFLLIMTPFVLVFRYARRCFDAFTVRRSILVNEPWRGVSSKCDLHEWSVATVFN